jgi:hypothetical protein
MRLPSPIRELALEMLRTFDPPSVEATTRFLASGAQPFEAASDLARIECPTVLIPGVDPEHPAELCELYAQHLKNVRIESDETLRNIERYPR